MTARKQKGNTNPHPVDSTTRTCCGGIGDHTAECPPALRIFDTAGSMAPVNLDPTAPEIVRWDELTGDVDIYHGGDASKVLDVPRPSWCDPDEDFYGDSIDSFGYGSAVARVVVSNGTGVSDGESLDPARVTVQALMAASGYVHYGIQICLSRATGADKDRLWINSKMTLTPAEALELADVLRAAVDLTGVEQ
ncbi:MAG: hypothetical protein HY898_28480 [Deltaproteobacteria bacterium]|nr:hypothetical protein [Deltaproteobacteria bacterium]